MYNELFLLNMIRDKFSVSCNIWVRVD